MGLMLDEYPGNKALVSYTWYLWLLSTYNTWAYIIHTKIKLTFQPISIVHVNKLVWQGKTTVKRPSQRSIQICSSRDLQFSCKPIISPHQEVQPQMTAHLKDRNHRQGILPNRQSMGGKRFQAAIGDDSSTKAVSNSSSE